MNAYILYSQLTCLFQRDLKILGVLILCILESSRVTVSTEITLFYMCPVDEFKLQIVLQNVYARVVKFLSNSRLFLLLMYMLDSTFILSLS